jgi:hypothetical protein
MIKQSSIFTSPASWMENHSRARLR